MMTPPIPDAGVPQPSPVVEQTKSENQHWGALATILWGVLIAIVFIVVQVLATVVYMVVPNPKLSAAEVQKLAPDLIYDGTLLSISSFITTIIVVPMIFVVIKLKRGSNLREYLGLTLPTMWDGLRWLVALMAFFFLADVTMVLLGQSIVPDFMIRTYSSVKHLWMLWVALLVCAPLLEELFFRGFLIKGLMESRLGWLGAVLISSAAWAFTHVQYDVYGTTMIFVLGLVLGTARVKSGSTLLTIGLHSIVNLGATIETVIRLHSSST